MRGRTGSATDAAFWGTSTLDRPADCADAAVSGLTASPGE